MSKMGYDEKHHMVFNTCTHCGTLNYFDESIYNVYAHAKCYHCGNLVEVPDAYKLIEETVFYTLQSKTIFKKMNENIHRSITKIEAWKITR